MPAGRFKPGETTAPSPYTWSKGGVKLGPNQSLHYREGQGYFAGPKAVAPGGGGGSGALPYLTPTQIATQAGGTARGILQAQTAPFIAQQAQNARDFGAQRAQTQGFNTASMNALGQIGPQTQAAYDLAGAQEGSLAKGFSSSLQDTLAADNAAAQQYAASQGAVGGNAPSAVSPAAFGDALYMGNGFIPGQSLIAQGAHAAQWAQGTKGVATAGARQDVLATNNAEAKAAAESASQIAKLAAKYPALFTAEEHALIKQNTEAYKLNQGDYKLALTANKNANDAGYKQGILNYYNRGQDTRDIVAANQAAYQVATVNERQNYHNATIRVRDNANKIALKKAQQAGHQIDKGASMATGVITFKDGTLLTGKDGTPVAVDPRVYSSSKSNDPKVIFGKMVKDARQSLSKPVKNTQTGGAAYFLAPGLEPNMPGDVAPDGLLTQVATTNDPARAQTGAAQSFSKMVTAFAAQYGVSKTMARKALIKGGWKSDDKLPPKKYTTPPFLPGMGG